MLGTDGFGRSDTREKLRDFFEISTNYIVLNALKSLKKEKLAEEFMKKNKIKLKKRGTMANIKTLELKIPNLGDAESTEIIEVNVKVGDKISINDPLIVLESEKAAMEVPSDFAGEISELLVSEGENVSEGQIFRKNYR